METLPAVADLIPHRDPVVFLTAILSVAEDRIRAEACVDSQRMQGVKSETVSAAVMLEVMGQAMAAHGGWLDRHYKTAPREGMIVSVRSFKTERAFLRDGEVGRAEAYLRGKDENGAQYECQVFDCLLIPVASARITIAMREDRV